MKKLILMAFTLVQIQLNAQPGNSLMAKQSPFEKAMLTNISQLDTASATSLKTIANNFERIGNAEKTKWEPFYYAAYCYTVMAYMSPDKSAIDGLADQADRYLQKAVVLDENNSELSVLAAMIVSCRIMVDPMGRFQTKAREVNELIAKSIELNPQNPRIYLLQARMQLRTPEAFGGGKKIARASVEKAIEKFEAFVPAGSVSPSWGYAQAKSLLKSMDSQ